MLTDELGGYLTRWLSSMVIVAGPIGYSWWWEGLDGLILMPVKVIVYHMQLGVKE